MSSDVQSALAQLQMNDYGSRWSFTFVVDSNLIIIDVAVVIAIAIADDYCKPSSSIFRCMRLE
jgi:hypothetical protein